MERRKPTPTNDAYTVLLSISLVAIIGACLLLFYDVKRYPSAKPPVGAERVAPPAMQPIGEVPEPEAVPATPEPAPADPGAPVPPPANP
jgi:hypothetical protein